MKELLYDMVLDLAIGIEIVKKALKTSGTVAWQPQAFTRVVPMCQMAKRSLLEKIVFQR